MIQAQELRIGNYLELLGEVIKVEGIFNLPKRKEMYWIKSEGIIDAKIIHFRPIPLTEEWLLDFGFKDINNKSFKLLKHTHHDVMFRIFDGGAISYCEKNEYVLVKSVHHIQNLYFALTGEELTLNK